MSIYFFIRYPILCYRTNQQQYLLGEGIGIKGIFHTDFLVHNAKKSIKL